MGDVDSRNIIADAGTRKGMTVEDVGPDSEWINGMSRMRRGDEYDFPVKTVAEIVLGGEGKNEATRETIVIDIIGEQDDNCSPFYNYIYMSGQLVPVEVGSRYEYSQYVIDTNRFRFRKVIRVLGLVYLFSNILLARINKTQGKEVIQCEWVEEIPDILTYQWDRYLVTTGVKSGNVGVV